ncbi:RyR domain-containing protein [Herbidospora yilanensis]|uniref:RyR domain-containing protein n=1 Tax=Herbidospora yilanensis TaxID=354426 RepID=UPI000785BBF8|nr:RyR domain-containing protein [Herbidospora yilanensis]
MPDPLSETAIDDLARAVHDHYLRTRRAAGDDETTNASLVTWDRLPRLLRADSRAHARDVPRKLAAVGCRLTRRSDLPPAALTDVEIERLARMEHVRWTLARLAAGWRPGPVHDAEARRHPDLVPWERLTEDARDKDRSTLRTLPAVLAVAGLRIVRGPAEAVL